MAANHPLAPLVLPACKRFPLQAAALFQTTVDLSLAQQWKDVEVVDLDECGCAIIKGRPLKSNPTSPPSFVYPMGLQTPTSLRQLTSVIRAIATRFPSATAATSADSASETAPTVSVTDAESSDPTSAATPTTTTVYLAMVEKDSSIVYYVLRNGVVSPKEVPE
ncbi:hypothetical protein BMF94_0560 [Rhodotorula taiwanensis]|uniref:tRNA-splicing endonuclease subunit Sen15 domain-containing protein n=1 Tax=Rhodotorula taiwanensis TaxID=741276 RepID=A0A2S5BHZ0_9BASI|nr:hypothetical protein BMF94_0560 [Rhodotorula taiwanensis]